MKAILEFNLPEETSEFKTANQAANYLIALQDIGNFLRGEYKYTELSEAESAYLEKIRDKFHEILTDNDVAEDV